MACRDLPWPETEPRPAAKALNPNHSGHQGIPNSLYPEGLKKCPGSVNQSFFFSQTWIIETPSPVRSTAYWWDPASPLLFFKSEKKNWVRKENCQVILALKPSSKLKSLFSALGSSPQSLFKISDTCLIHVSVLNSSIISSLRAGQRIYICLFFK